MLMLLPKIAAFCMMSMLMLHMQWQSDIAPSQDAAADDDKSSGDDSASSGTCCSQHATFSYCSV